MGILDFIFCIIALFVGAFIIIGTVSTIYDYKTLKKENEELKEKLRQARKRKSGGKK